MEHGFEKFESLPEERREAIVGAAVETFGLSDYKGASTDAIARKAGISKGLLFFYFKNKRELYLYLMRHLMDVVTKVVVDERFYEIDDFFELFKYAANRKKDALSKMPYLLDFSIRAFYPEHKDVKDTMNGWTQAQIDLMFSTFFKNVRLDKFRDGVEPKKVVDMMIWMADGYLHQQRSMSRAIDIDALMVEFDEWCEMFKRYAYKEEFQ
ncbi:MAG: TetR/AcrR family transcriptional regulator [Gordonibacter sp.]|uniref:TetR/AcrR family transcriptional regulator n=1 Tax=Gordonibacter sp. TaxID=1968902 RepID=UPI002FCAD943